MPYGFFSTEGAEYVFPTGNGDGGIGVNGTYGPSPAMAAQEALGNATLGSMIQYCYTGASYFCTCYQADGCYYYAPIGTGGVAHTVCGGLRSHGFRGGPGAVRIRYVAD